MDHETPLSREKAGPELKLGLWSRALTRFLSRLHDGLPVRWFDVRDAITAAYSSQHIIGILYF